MDLVNFKKPLVPGNRKKPKILTEEQYVEVSLTNNTFQIKNKQNNASFSGNVKDHPKRFLPRFREVQGSE